MPPPGARRVLFAVNRYVTMLHRGVARRAKELGWHLNAESVYFGRLPRGWQGDGILCLLDRDESLLRFVLRAGVPVVDTVALREDVPLPRVVGDQHEIGRLAAGHFLERGFRNFAWFSSWSDIAVERRKAGFQDALQAAGFDCAVWQLKGAPQQKNRSWLSRHRFLIERLRRARLPLAVFAFRDADAVRVLDACEETKLDVPGDVAILGADNDELVCESVRVPISSVNHDLERIGYEAASLLQRLMDGEAAPPQPVVIPPNGVTVRRSTDILAVADPLVRRALAYLKENLPRPAVLAHMATELGVTPRALNRLFRQHLGRTVKEETVAMRLRAARDLLTTSNLPAIDVAAATGFSSPQYFNNVFRRATNLTPRAYRAKVATHWHTAGRRR